MSFLRTDCVAIMQEQMKRGSVKEVETKEKI